MEHCIKPKSKLLQNVVHSFEEMNYSPQSFGESYSQKMIPDGMSEIWTVIGDDLKIAITPNIVPQPVARSFFLGLTTRYMHVQTETKIKVFVTRLYPWAAHDLFKVRADELADSAVDATDLLGSCFSEFQDRINVSRSFGDAAERAEQTLLKRLNAPCGASRLLLMTIRAILERKGIISVSRLARELGVSRQFLNRLHKQETGLSVKQMCSTIRLRIGIDRQISDPFDSLTQLAHSLHYFDQSHFNREFKQMTGDRPGKFFQQRHFITGHVHSKPKPPAYLNFLPVVRA